MITKIYTLSDPITNEVRYVGKTINESKRIENHIYHHKGITHKSCWVKSLLAKKLKPIFEVIDETNGDWRQLEQYWISQLKAWGFDLTNMGEGGEGVEVTKEVRLKMSIAKLGKKRDRAAVEKGTIKLKGQKRTEQQKKNISMSKIGKPCIMTERKKEVLAKMILMRIGVKHSKETINKMSEKRRQYWLNKNK